VEILVFKIALADLVHDEGAIVDSELNHSLLGLLYCLKKLIWLHQGATFHVRHQTFWTQSPCMLFEQAHLLLSRNDLVKHQFAFADLLEHLIVADLLHA